MDRQTYEVNFDGIVGPTHNYGGLSYGNTASELNQFRPSNPREAALQGLEKMKFLADLGIKQAVLPPQERPFLPVLRHLGFSGSNNIIIKNVYKDSPELLLAVSSAASMWAANAATISPSADSVDGKMHLTPANLSNKFHRSIETETTSRILRKIFDSPDYFFHHDSLPPGSYFGDEGAANHTRFCKTYAQPGIQLFVYGRHSFQDDAQAPKIYPARQTLEASASIARLHQLDPNKVIFAQQNPEAIDAGAFHNDVVSVGNQHVFFFHEEAFCNKEELLKEILEKAVKECHLNMCLLEVKSKDVPLKDAVSSYLFNSQLITDKDNKMVLISPIECKENLKIRSYIEKFIPSSSHPIKKVHYLDIRQSMQNGGGPACLRLRIVLTEQELAAAHQGVFLTADLYQKLRAWIINNYRERLEKNDLADPVIYEEGRRALDELTQILKLGPIYSFQR